MARRSRWQYGRFHRRFRCHRNYCAVVRLTYIAVALAITTVISTAFAVRFYMELWKWAKQCQRAQIAIAYKRKVKLSAPLVEWLLWCNQLKDKDENGRVVFSLGGTSVAILKGKTPPSRIRQALRTGRKQPKRTAAPIERTGSWSAKDETVRT